LWGAVYGGASFAGIGVWASARWVVIWRSSARREQVEQLLRDDKLTRRSNILPVALPTIRYNKAIRQLAFSQLAILRQSVIVELSATTMRIGEQIMLEEIAALERRGYRS
jgi:hypothetical protein